MRGQLKGVEIRTSLSWGWYGFKLPQIEAKLIPDANAVYW